MTAGERVDRVVATTAAVRTALDAAVRHLRGRQHEDGWWKGLLATNVTMDAEDLMLRTFLGIATPRTNEETARWIRSGRPVDNCRGVGRPAVGRRSAR
jgi:squalene-hopene/tetraprenyl-beta-curcumene cyclase